MTSIAPAPTPQDTGGGNRTMYWIVGGVALMLVVIGLFTYSAHENNEEAQALAAELTQKLEAAGLRTPEDQEDTADDPVHRPVAAAGLLRGGCGGHGRHVVSSASALFQLGLRNLRNSHGGNSPSSTVPARITPA